jgi:hypothetical protein
VPLSSSAPYRRSMVSRKDEQAVIETIVTPSRQVVDSQAGKVTLQDVEIMATLAGRLKKAREARTKINADEETGDIITVR